MAYLDNKHMITPFDTGLPTCPYCGKDAELVLGHRVYPFRKDLHTRKFWLCADCDAYVGTHMNSPKHKPFGTLANAELRRARREVHKVLDPLWQSDTYFDKMTRTQAYAWLAKTLSIATPECHIGKFDLEMCDLAIATVQENFKHDKEEPDYVRNCKEQG